MSLILWIPATAAATSATTELRVADVVVADDGVVTATVVVPAFDAEDAELGNADLGEAFEVRVAGQLRDVDAARVEPDEVAIAVVADTSDDLSDAEFREVRNVVMELALRLPGETELALVSAGSPAAVVQGPTADVVERAQAVGSLEHGGERALYDAVGLAVDELSGLSDVHRRVVVVGAGVDEASSLTQADVTERLADSNAALYVIGVGDARAEGEDLADVASSTGGAVVEGEGPFEAASAALDDLVNQQQLTFRTDGAADVPVTIRLSADGVTAETSFSIPAASSEPADRQLADDPAAAEDDEVSLAAPGASSQEGEAETGWPLRAIAVTAAVLLIAAVILVAVRTTTVTSTLVGRSGAAARGAGRRITAAGSGMRRASGSARQRLQAALTTTLSGGGRAAGSGLSGVRRATGSAFSGAGSVGRRSIAATRTATTAAGATTRRSQGAAAVAARRLRGIPSGATRRLSATTAILAAVAARVRPERRATTPTGAGWQDTAASVHRESGGDETALRQAATNIEAARQTMAAYVRAAGLDGRVMAMTLTPLPVVVGVMRSVIDRTYLDRVTADALGWVVLGAAGILTIAGGLWLWQVATPPFQALAGRRRRQREQTARWQQIADALDLAWLYVVAGEDLELALKRALPDERRYGPMLQRALHPDESAGTPADVLAATRMRLYADWQDAIDDEARSVPLQALVPFVTCLVPAMLLVGLVRL